MSKTRVGFALTGSYCTFSRVFLAMEQLMEEGLLASPADLYSLNREELAVLNAIRALFVKNI